MIGEFTFQGRVVPLGERFFWGSIVDAGRDWGTRIKKTKLQPLKKRIQISCA